MTNTYSTPIVMEQSAAHKRQMQLDALRVLNNEYKEWKHIPELHQVVVSTYEQLFDGSLKKDSLETHFIHYFHLKTRLELLNGLWLFQRTLVHLAKSNDDETTVGMISSSRKKIWSFSEARLGLYCFKLEQAIEIYEPMLLLIGYTEETIFQMKRMLIQLDGSGHEIPINSASSSDSFHISPNLFSNQLLPLLKTLLPQNFIVQELVLAANAGDSHCRDQKSDEKAA